MPKKKDKNKNKDKDKKINKYENIYIYIVEEIEKKNMKIYF